MPSGGGADGLPLIARRDDAGNKLHLNHYDDVACSSATGYTPDPNLGGYLATMTIDALGLPVISHIANPFDLRVTAVVDTGWGRDVDRIVDHRRPKSMKGYQDLDTTSVTDNGMRHSARRRHDPPTRGIRHRGVER